MCSKKYVILCLYYDYIMWQVRKQNWLFWEENMCYEGTTKTTVKQKHKTWNMQFAPAQTKTLPSLT